MLTVQADQGECTIEAGYTGEEGGEEEGEGGEELEHAIEELSGGRYRAVMQVLLPYMEELL